MPALMEARLLVFAAILSLLSLSVGAVAAEREAPPAVRAIAEFELVRLRDGAAARATAASNDGAKAHWLAIAQLITRYQEKGEVPAVTPALIAPPGDPFGDDWPSPDGP